jgi:hypothetical protein
VPLPTLEQVKDELRITNAEHDNQLPTFLGTAIRMIASRCGPLTPTDLVEDRRNVTSSLLILHEWPVLAVTTVTLFPSARVLPGQDFTTGGDGYVLDPDVPSLEYRFGGANVRVAYRAGRSELSEDLHRALLDLTAHLWRASQNRTGLGQRAVFGGSNPSQDAPFPAGFALPRRVEEQIEGELRPPVVA